MNWEDHGCEGCRTSALRGGDEAPLRECYFNIIIHADLRHCNDCGAWWKFGEREAHVISESEARMSFPDYFSR